MSFGIVEGTYVAITAVLAVAGLVLVGAAVRAYVRTKNRAMVHLSLGFTFVVAAVVTTALSAFLVDFEPTRSLLLVNNGFATAGVLTILYSLLAYDR
jgi:uncharacterized membrane protein